MRPRPTCLAGWCPSGAHQTPIGGLRRDRSRRPGGSSGHLDGEIRIPWSFAISVFPSTRSRPRRSLPERRRRGTGPLAERAAWIRLLWWKEGRKRNRPASERFHIVGSRPSDPAAIRTHGPHGTERKSQEKKYLAGIVFEMTRAPPARCTKKASAAPPPELRSPQSSFSSRRSQRATEERNTSSGQQQLPWSSGISDSYHPPMQRERGGDGDRRLLGNSADLHSRGGRSRTGPPGKGASALFDRPESRGGAQRRPFNVSEVGPGRVRAQRPRARGLSERKGGAQRRLAAPSDASTRAPRGAPTPPRGASSPPRGAPSQRPTGANQRRGEGAPGARDDLSRAPRNSGSGGGRSAGNGHSARGSR